MSSLAPSQVKCGTKTWLNRCYKSVSQPHFTSLKVSPLVFPSLPLIAVAYLDGTLAIYDISTQGLRHRCQHEVGRKRERVYTVCVCVCALICLVCFLVHTAIHSHLSSLYILNRGFALISYISWQPLVVQPGRLSWANVVSNIYRDAWRENIQLRSVVVDAAFVSPQLFVFSPHT